MRVSVGSTCDVLPGPVMGVTHVEGHTLPPPGGPHCPGVIVQAAPLEPPVHPPVAVGGGQTNGPVVGIPVVVVVICQVLNQAVPLRPALKHHEAGLIIPESNVMTSDYRCNASLTCRSPRAPSRRRGPP